MIVFDALLCNEDLSHRPLQLQNELRWFILHDARSVAWYGSAK
jgi:hypothetical protein